MNKCRVALLSALLASTGAKAAGDVDLNIGGFVWGDVGFGDRYDASDDDQVKVAKAAISISPEYENVRAVAILGVDNALNGSGSDSADFQEIFVGLKTDLLGGTLDTTIGKQPVLFGLKPNGWVGDRSVVDGLEYGVAGGINVSGLVATSVIFDWSFGGGGSGSSGSSIGDDGSWSVRGGFAEGGVDTGLSDTYFVQFRGDDLFGTGIYGNAGFASVDGGTGFAEGDVISVGAGIMIGQFDISLEYQGIEDTIAGTADDETQIIAEATFNLNEQWAFYADYATADEADVDTLRVGTSYAYNDHVTGWLEYADDSTNFAATDVSSVEARIAFSF